VDEEIPIGAQIAITYVICAGLFLIVIIGL
jgi:hypothetical protein